MAKKASSTKQKVTTVQSIAAQGRALRAAPKGGNQFTGLTPNNPNQPVPGATKKSAYTNQKSRPLPETEYLSQAQQHGLKVLRKFLGKSE